MKKAQAANETVMIDAYASDKDIHKITAATVLNKPIEEITKEVGEFKEEITLSSEVNKISVQVISKFGQKASLDRVVYLKR